MLTLLVQSDLFKVCTNQISFPGILSLFFSVYCSPSPILKLTVAVSLQSLQQHLTWSSRLLWWSAPSFGKGQVLRCAQLHGPCWVLCPLPLGTEMSSDQNKHLCPKNGDLTPLLGILAGWAALLLPSVLLAWPQGSLLSSCSLSSWLLQGLGLQVLPQSMALVNKQSNFCLCIRPDMFPYLYLGQQKSWEALGKKKKGRDLPIFRLF